MNHVQENINVEIRRIRKMIQEWIELPSFADGLLVYIKESRCICLRGKSNEVEALQMAIQHE